jgi:alpha-L-rhamnosidase
MLKRINKIKISGSLLAGILSFAWHAATGNVQVTGLKCEYAVNPLGIDAPHPRLSWLMSDSRRGALQTAYQIVVGTDSLSVANEQGAVWNTQKVRSGNMLVRYDGEKLQPFTKYYWSVKIWDKDGVVSQPALASFETGMMEMRNWQGAWISDGGDVHLKPAPCFRKEFEAHKKINSARAYIAVAGLYELYINGERIGDHRLDPMWTRFDRRNLYVTYDVTAQLKSGKNAAGILLGNGWYNLQSGETDWRLNLAPWRNRPAFCLDIRITYHDGSVEIVKTGNDWKTGLSPVISNSIYTAEHYDARLAQPGWDKAGFDDSQWKPAEIRPAPSQNIVAQQLHPIRDVEKIPVKNFRKISDTHYFFDLGRNFAGVSQLRVKGEAGTVVTLEHAERAKDGKIDISNLSVYYTPADENDLFAKDVFILNGQGEETFMPRFNYKGFQYVEVKSSNPIALTAESLTGWFMHSDVPPAGSFETSNPLINKIWEATNASYLSNLFGLPTDCPHREKLGWTNDAHCAVESGLYNFDAITIYEKWLADFRDAQQPNGVLPGIVPTGGWGYHWGNGLDCTSAIAIIPWTIYQFYGDTRILEDNYENIRRYVDYIAAIAPSGLPDWGLGDWTPIKSQTSPAFTSPIFYYADADILARTAQLLGKNDDYRKYATLAEKIKTAFNNRFLNSTTGIYGEGNQAQLSMPLYWGLVPAGLKRKVAANLAQRVHADNDHLDVGEYGSKAILNALSENGYADLAYTVASQETRPSWGYWIKNGATTLHESFMDEETAVGSKMKSDNHVMMGEISAWFYKALAGIRVDAENPGFKHILLKPNFVKGLNYVEASYMSPYGKIVAGWKREKKSVVYRVTVPANTTADLYLPEGYRLKKPLQEQNADGSYALAAGSYEYELRVKN